MVVNRDDGEETASEPKPDGRPFAISARLAWEAWLRVKANNGALGVDEQSMQAFEANLRGNLYKLWKRMSSGRHMPLPARAVEIPKRDGRGVRTLGPSAFPPLPTGSLRPSRACT